LRRSLHGRSSGHYCVVSLLMVSSSDVCRFDLTRLFELKNFVVVARDYGSGVVKFNYRGASIRNNKKEEAGIRFNQDFEIAWTPDDGMRRFKMRQDSNWIAIIQELATHTYTYPPESYAPINALTFSVTLIKSFVMISLCPIIILTPCFSSHGTLTRRFQKGD
jgi:hypothetical protein